jgi:hypothetical protein
MIAKSFLRRWLWVIAAGGVLTIVQGLRLSLGLWNDVLLGIGAVLLLFTMIAVIWLMVAEARTKKIRRLIGRHARGSSDPATWTQEDLEAVPDCQAMFGYPHYQEAVDAMLDKVDLRGAMWAARLCLVKEDPLRGEQLTAQVLRHPEVRRVLPMAEDNPAAWMEFLHSRQAVTKEASS